MKLDIQRFAVTFTGKEATGNYSWAKIQGRVICEETYVGTSTENKSTVKCTVQARVTTGGTTAANWRAGATIGDDEQTGKLTSNTKFVDSWKTIKEFTFDVPHDEDGSKTIEISGYAQAPEYPTSLGDAKSTFSGEMKLTTIPRESSISVNKETATLGDTIRITINRKSSSFSENLAFILSSPDTGSQNVEAVGVSATYYDYVITEETYKYLTGTQGFLTISGTTLDENDKVVASTNTVSVEILTPDSMIPSVEIGDLYENGSIVPSSWGIFVKGKSEMGIPVSATGVNGSTIKNISMKDSNDSGVYVINSSSGIFSTNKVKANGTLTITATDTRGKSASKTVEYEVVDYANPVLSTYSAKKVNSEGAEDDNGQYIMFSVGGTISSCGGNNVKKLYVAVNNQTNWISVADDTVDAVLSDTTIDPNVKNTVYFKIEDSLGGSEIKSVPIDSVFRLMNFNKTLTAVALGKKSSAADNEELLEVDMDSKFYKDIEATNVVSRNIFNAWNYNYENDVRGCKHIINNTNKITFNVEADWARKKVIFKLNPNTTYTINANIINNNGIYCGFWDGTDNNTSFSNSTSFNSKITFTTDYNGEFGVWFYCNFNSNVVSGQVIFDNIQLEEGSTATDYVPYLNLQETILKDTEARLNNVVSKNVFNTRLEQGSVTYVTGEKSPNDAYVRTTNKIKVKPNTTYTISYKGVSPTLENGFIFFKDGVYVGYDKSKTTITIPGNANEVMYNWNNGGAAINPNMIYDIQLEEGSNATDYVPHLNLEEAMPKLKVIDVGKSNYVKQGYISAIQFGNIVVVEVSELFITEDRNEWTTFIGWGLPKPYLPGGGWTKGVMADNRGIGYIGNDGNLYISQRTNVQLANVEYNCQIVYITLD